MFVFNYDDIYDIVKSRDHINSVIIEMSIINFIMGRCVLVFPGGFTLLMTHERVFEGCVVFSVAKVIHFNSSIIDQCFYSPFKGIKFVG